MLGLALAVAGLSWVSLRLGEAETQAVAAAGRTLGQTLGARVVVGGPVEIHLFPRPQVVVANVSLQDPSGDAHLDIPTLKGTLTLASLVSGRIGFSRLQLIDPTGWIDADRISLQSERTRLGPLEWALPSKIVLTSALIALRSNNPALSGLVTDLDAVLDGLNADGAASVTGRGSWRGQRTEISAHLDPFADFLAGRPTAGSLKIHAPLLSAAVSGSLQRGVNGGFEGSVSASTPSLSSLLRLADNPGGLGQVVEHASFTATGSDSEDGLTFSDTHLVLNATAFEGSLAWQHNQGRGAVTGTLATDMLDLTPLLAMFPAARKPDGSWNDATLPLDPSSWHDVDLRISANEAKLGPIEAEDAALSALCRDGRIEVSLGEAQSFDGLIKGRAVASVADQALDVKLDLSVTRVSVADFSSALLASKATGLGSGHFTGEGRGGSVRSLIQSLDGHGQISVRKGDFPGLSTFAGLVFPSDATTGRSRRAATSFDLATTDFRVGHGVVSIDDGSVTGPDRHFAFRGQASLLNRGFSLSSVTVPPDDGGGPSETPAPMKVVGFWGQPFHVIRLERAAGDKWQPPIQAPEFFP